MVVVAMVGRIQLYTPDGQEVEATEYGPCRQEANWPHHMAFCPKTGYIAAVDSDNIDPDNYKACKTPGQTSHIIMMDKRLNLKFRCRQGYARTRGQFLPISPVLRCLF